MEYKKNENSIFELYNMFWYYPERHTDSDPNAYFNGLGNTLNDYKIPAIILYPAFLTPAVIQEGKPLHLMLAVKEEDGVKLTIADVNAQLKFTLGLDSYKCVNKATLFESLENDEIKIEKVAEKKDFEFTKTITLSKGPPIKTTPVKNKTLTVPGFKGVIYFEIIKMYLDSGYESIYHIELKNVWTRGSKNGEQSREGLLLDKIASTVTGNVKENINRLNIYESERLTFKEEFTHTYKQNLGSNRQEFVTETKRSCPIERDRRAALKGEKGNHLVPAEKNDKFIRRVLNEMNGDELEEAGKYSHRHSLSPALKREVYEADWNDPIQSYHPLFVHFEGHNRSYYNLAHMADLHVSSRQELLAMSPARVIENFSSASISSPEIGTMVNISSSNVKDFFNRTGNDPEIDLLLIGGDLIDHVPNTPIDSSIDQITVKKLWEMLEVDFAGRSTYLESKYYQKFTDLIYFYTTILDFYRSYKKPVYLVSGNHDAYPYPYGISPRLTDFLLYQIKDFIAGKALGISEVVKKVVNTANKVLNLIGLVFGKQFNYKEKVINSRLPDKYLGRNFIDKHLGVKFNENIPADHNLTFYEAILAFGNSFGEVKIGTPQLDSKLFKWFFSVFTPFTDYSLELKKQIIIGLHWGGDEDLVDVFGGQSAGHLPRSDDAVTDQQYKLLKETIDNNSSKKKIILSTHFTFLCYKEAIPFLNKEIAKIKVKGSIIPNLMSGRKSMDTTVRRRAADDYSKYEMGTFETNRAKVYEKIFPELDCIFTGHSHRRGLYGLTGTLNDTEAAGAFFELSTAGYNGKLDKARGDAEQELYNNWNFSRQTENFKSPAIIVSDSLGPIPRYNKGGEFCGWGSDYPSGTKVKFDQKGGTIEAIELLQIKNHRTKPRFVVALDYWDILVKKEEPHTKFIDYELDIHSFESELEAVPGELKELIMRRIKKLKSKKITSAKDLAKVLNKVRKRDIVKKIGDSDILKRIYVRELLRGYNQLLENNRKMNSRDSYQQFLSNEKTYTLRELNIAILRELFRETTKKSYALWGLIISEEMADQDKLFFFLNFSPFLKDNGVSVESFNFHFYNSSGWETFESRVHSFGAYDRVTKSRQQTLYRELLKFSPPLMLNHYFSLKKEECDLLLSDDSGPAKCFISVKFSYNENGDKVKLFKQYDFSSHWNFPVDVKVEGGRLIIERDKYKAEVPDFKWYEDNFEKYK